MTEYEITYRISYVGYEGCIRGGPELTFRCHAKSKSKALKKLVNLESVHQVFKIKKVKRKRKGKGE